MSQHDSLRGRTQQHLPKNTKSKTDDKDVYKSMKLVQDYLTSKPEFQTYFTQKFSLLFEHQIDVSYMINFIKKKGLRAEFNTEFADRTIVPDGGILYLVNNETKEKFPLVIAEIKRQGTNKEREAEGKNKQATGNAIERLGKNLTGIRTMMNYEKITPFVCFGWGCDFAIDQEDTGTVRSKVIMMNEFYNLNQIYIFKRDGDANNNNFAPVSMYFREEKWTVQEMFTIMKEIAEASIRYYLY
jgi:type II restriction enzyme